MAKTAMDLVMAAKEKIAEVSVDKANEMLDHGSIALDVRETAEYATAHIPDAHHIARGVLEFQIGNHPAFNDKEASIVVYCRSGGRSALAALALEELGYSNVVSMATGFDGWSAS